MLMLRAIWGLYQTIYLVIPKISRNAPASQMVFSKIPERRGRFEYLTREANRNTVDRCFRLSVWNVHDRRTAQSARYLYMVSSPAVEGRREGLDSIQNSTKECTVDNGEEIWTVDDQNSSGDALSE